MKKTIIALCFFSFLAGVAYAQVYVNPYVRNDGTHVQGHYRSAPDGNPYNNYSTRGNTNPFTGERGYNRPENQHGERNYGLGSILDNRSIYDKYGN